MSPFEAEIPNAPEEHRPLLQKLCDWARGIERSVGCGCGRITPRGTGEVSLLPHLRSASAGLVTIYKVDGPPSIQFWRSVFEQYAADHIARVEGLISPKLVGQGTTTTSISDELLEVLADAYRTATK